MEQSQEHDLTTMYTSWRHLTFRLLGKLILYSASPNLWSASVIAKIFRFHLYGFIIKNYSCMSLIRRRMISSKQRTPTSNPDWKECFF